MANMETTVHDTGTVVIWEPVFENDTVTFTGEGVYKRGTILARDTGTLKLVPYVKGGTTTGNGVPKAVLTYDVEATAAGDKGVRVAVAGRLRKNKLVIQADGDDSNVDKDVVDQLRDFGIVALETTELAELDNQ